MEVFGILWEFYRQTVYILMYRGVILTEIWYIVFHTKDTDERGQFKGAVIESSFQDWLFIIILESISFSADQRQHFQEIVGKGKFSSNRTWLSVITNM